MSIEKENELELRRFSVSNAPRYDGVTRQALTAKEIVSEAEFIYNYLIKESK